MLERKTLSIVFILALVLWFLDAELHWFVYGASDSLFRFLWPNLWIGLLRGVAIFLVISLVLSVISMGKNRDKAEEEKSQAKVYLLKTLHAKRNLEAANMELG